MSSPAAEAISRLTHIPSGRTRIEVEIVQSTLRTLDCSVFDLMALVLPVAASFSRTPLSGFPVGAVAMGLPEPGSGSPVGHLYLGATLEFADQPLSLGVHAEQSAISNAWLHGERGIRYLATTSAPCGFCRQFLLELGVDSSDLELVFTRSDGIWEPTPLTELLPSAFEPAELGISAFLMDAGPPTKAEPFDEAVASAARASHAPYTGALSAVGLSSRTGVRVIGRYVESVAYNPSLSACEAALNQFSLAHPPGGALEIDDALLVQVRHPIDFSAQAAAMLTSISSGAKLRTTWL